MRGHDYELTDEQHTVVHDVLPRIADLALAYLISSLPRDNYFDAWASMIVGAGDTSSWGDDALGCALIDVGEKYEKLVKANSSGNRFSPDSLAAEVRGALLHAGSLLVSVNNHLISEKDVAQAIVVAVEKFNEAKTKLAELNIPTLE